MKKILIALIVLTVVIGSLWAAESYDNLAKLVKSKVGDDVILAYIDVSNVNFALTPDEIIQLKDLGASGKVITAAIQHRKQTEAPRTMQPAVAPSGDADNSIVYEAVAPPADYWYGPYPGEVVVDPVWQPYYYYPMGYGPNYVYSYGRGRGGSYGRNGSGSSGRSGGGSSGRSGGGHRDRR